MPPDPTWEPTWPPAPAGTTTLAGRIGVLRTARGWTQQQMADRLGISRVAVSHLEAGINSPDARTVALLAGLFRMEPQDLVRGTDYPAAKVDRLPLVVARYTEVEHQIALMDAELAWVDAARAGRTGGGSVDRRSREAVAERWRPTLAKLFAATLDPAESDLLDAARARLEAACRADSAERPDGRP